MQTILALLCKQCKLRRLGGAWIESALEPRRHTFDRMSGRGPRQNSAAERFFSAFAREPIPAALKFIRELDPFDPFDVGLLVGLNRWSRERVRTSQRPRDDPFAVATIEDIRRESPIIIVLAVPAAIKLGSAAAAGAFAVVKGIDKYYKVKKTRSEGKLVDAQANEARANAEKTREETLQIRETTRRLFEEAQIGATVKRELQAGAVRSGTLPLDEAAVVGERIAEVAVAGLEANPAVAEVNIEDL
jgi:hypothetical protein